VTNPISSVRLGTEHGDKPLAGNHGYILGTGESLTVCRQPLPWDYFRVARDSGVANCQHELRFLRSAGRRSAHFRMASSV